MGSGCSELQLDLKIGNNWVLSAFGPIRCPALNRGDSISHRPLAGQTISQHCPGRTFALLGTFTFLGRFHKDCKMEEDKAQELIEAFAQAHRAVTWALAGGDAAEAEDVAALELAEANLLAALTKKSYRNMTANYSDNAITAYRTRVQTTAREGSERTVDASTPMDALRKTLSAWAEGHAQVSSVREENGQLIAYAEPLPGRLFVDGRTNVTVCVSIAPP